MLHQRVTEIFLILLDKTAAATDDEALINSVLYETDLLRKILDTAKEGALFTFATSGHSVSKGNMPFVRRLANKLLDLQSKSDEVACFLEAIPEWAEYCAQDLRPRNELENRPLGHDPRGRTDSSTSPSDEYFDLMFKIREVGSRKPQPQTSNNECQEENEEDEQSPEELAGFENQEEEEFDRIMFKSSGADEEEEGSGLNGGLPDKDLRELYSSRVAH